MKKFILFSLSLTLALGLTTFLKSRNFQSSVDSSSSWNTYSKSSDKKIIQYTSTLEELEEAKIIKTQNSNVPTTEATARMPASEFHGNRTLVGEISSELMSKLEKLPMLNTVNPEWQEHLGHELVRFHPQDTKVLIKKEESLIKVQNSKGLFTERVIISYLKGDHPVSSFRALIDSESGKVLETWDRTIHEHIINPQQRREILRIPSSAGDNGISATIK